LQQVEFVPLISPEIVQVQTELQAGQRLSDVLPNCNFHFPYLLLYLKTLNAVDTDDPILIDVLTRIFLYNCLSFLFLFETEGQLPNYIPLLSSLAFGVGSSRKSLVVQCGDGVITLILEQEDASQLGQSLPVFLRYAESVDCRIILDPYLLRMIHDHVFVSGFLRAVAALCQGNPTFIPSPIRRDFVCLLEPGIRNSDPLTMALLLSIIQALTREAVGVVITS
jgi:hypothetical protein